MYPSNQAFKIGLIFSSIIGFIYLGNNFVCRFFTHHTTEVPVTTSARSNDLILSYPENVESSSGEKIVTEASEEGTEQSVTMSVDSTVTNTPREDVSLTVGTISTTDMPDEPIQEDIMERHYLDIVTVNRTEVTDNIPKAFDARLHWPQCKDVIGKVWDQGSCAACWAVSAASVMTDRFCIQSNGFFKQILSPQHLLCSCTNCTILNSKSHMSQCSGGDSEAAWKFWQHEGLVTGGDYGTLDSCLPYLSPPCIHASGKPPAENRTQCGVVPESYECPQKCANNDKVDLNSEKKYKGSNIYYVINDTLAIQREILKNGPVQAKFTFDNKKFNNYIHGIFECEPYVKSHHVHSVKIIGWNVTDTGLEYWLCVNSYNTDWGEEGLFKIERGAGGCNIEQAVLAGIALLENNIVTDTTGATER